MPGEEEYTSESIYRPLLKLLQRNFRRRRDFVEIQTMRIFMLLVRGICKLLLLVVEACPPFGVEAINILSNHAVGVINSNNPLRR